MAVEKIVKEWMQDYASLSKEEVHTFATTQLENNALIEALYELFEQHKIGPNPVSWWANDFWEDIVSRYSVGFILYLPLFILP